MESDLATALDEGRRAFAEHRWQDAFELLSAADGGERLAADDLARLAEAARWSGNYDAMFNAFERAVSMYGRSGDLRRAARMALELTIEHFYRDNESAYMGWYSRAVTLLGDDTDCAEYGLTLWPQARMLLDAGQIDEARQVLLQMLEVGRRVGDSDVEALARLDLGHADVVDGRIPEGLRSIDEANVLVMGGGTALWTTGVVYCSTIWACRNLGDWRRAREWTDNSTRWCERESVSHFPGLCRFHRAEVVRIRGDLEQAERDAERGGRRTCSPRTRAARRGPSTSSARSAAAAATTRARRRRSARRSSAGSTRNPGSRSSASTRARSTPRCGRSRRPSTTRAGSRVRGARSCSPRR